MGGDRVRRRDAIHAANESRQKSLARMPCNAQSPRTYVNGTLAAARALAKPSEFCELTMGSSTQWNTYVGGT